jgi:hypothetical protein
MATDDITNQLATLRDASTQLAVGFTRLAQLTDQTEQAGGLEEAAVALREMFLAVNETLTALGKPPTFNPDAGDANRCERCGYTLDAHLGADCRCPSLTLG